MTANRSNAIKVLAEGFSRFSEREYEETGVMKTLVRDGQHPTFAMLICADSRTPDQMFDQQPGTIFVPYRGVGALYRGQGENLDVDAGIEYGVRHLGVSVLVDVGHYGCGFMKAMVHQNEDEMRGTSPEAGSDVSRLITDCTPLYKRVSDRFNSIGVCRDCASHHRHVTEEGVRWSVENLQANRYVRKAVEAGKLQVVGLIDDMDTGELRILNPVTSKFDVLVGHNRPPVVPIVAPHCASPETANKHHRRIDVFHHTVGCAHGQSRPSAA